MSSIEYIFTNDTDKCIYIGTLTNKSIRHLIWLTTRSIHCIWYYRQLLAHLISIYTYIDSLRHVLHLYIICTQYHLLVYTNVIYDSLLSRQKFPNNNRVKPTNAMLRHKNLKDVAVCRENLFCYSLNNGPIIFTHILCIIYQ